MGLKDKIYRIGIMEMFQNLPEAIVQKILIMRPRHPVAQLIKDEYQRIDGICEHITMECEGVCDELHKIPDTLKFWIDYEYDVFRLLWYKDEMLEWTINNLGDADEWLYTL